MRLPSSFITILQKNGGSHDHLAPCPRRRRPRPLGSAVCPVVSQPDHTEGPHPQAAVGAGHRALPRGAPRPRRQPARSRAAELVAGNTRWGYTSIGNVEQVCRKDTIKPEISSSSGIVLLELYRYSRKKIHELQRFLRMVENDAESSNFLRSFSSSA